MKEELEEFKEILDKIYATKVAKASDYGNSWKLLGAEGLFMQICSKFVRFYNLKDKQPGDIKNEPLIDTLLDMAVYCIMSIQLIKSGDTENKITKLIKQ